MQKRLEIIDVYSNKGITEGLRSACESFKRFIAFLRSLANG
jgi:hypothetical protein